jgi:hypothetical protein
LIRSIFKISTDQDVLAVINLGSTQYEKAEVLFLSPHPQWTKYYSVVSDKKDGKLGELAPSSFKKLLDKTQNSNFLFDLRISAMGFKWNSVSHQMDIRVYLNVVNQVNWTRAKSASTSLVKEHEIVHRMLFNATQKDLHWSDCLL